MTLGLGRLYRVLLLFLLVALERMHIGILDGDSAQQRVWQISAAGRRSRSISLSSWLGAVTVSKSQARRRKQASDTKVLLNYFAKMTNFTGNSRKKSFFPEDIERTRSLKIPKNNSQRKLNGVRGWRKMKKKRLPVQKQCPWPPAGLLIPQQPSSLTCMSEMVPFGNAACALSSALWRDTAIL